jgi:putative membrane protein
VTAERRPRRVFGVGKEPDPRFTLANERTFLAWIRTALALLAAGVALDTLVDLRDEGLRTAAALVLIVSGTAASVTAHSRWMATERALRLGQPLPASRIAFMIACAVAAAGLLAVVLLLRR